MITIVVSDDHKIVIDGIRALLGQQSDFRVLAEASDGLETVRVVDELKPQVLVQDLSIPRLHGLEVLRRVRKESPDTRVLVLSSHANEAYVLEALRNGATGYLLKETSSEELVRAIRSVAAGKRYLSGTLSELAIEAFIQRRSDDTAQEMYETLTDRERETLQLAAEGLGNADIAKKLFISPRTVETHRANIMRKLSLKTQTDLVLFAIRKGILSV